MNIKILGAGVGGLSTAALKRKGFDVDVFERHHRRSNIGAGIICWPNASFLLNELGLLEDIAMHSGKPMKMQRLSKDGDDLGALDIQVFNKKMGYSSYSIFRKDIMRTLETHLDNYGVEVKYGNKIEKLDSSKSGTTIIVFENGDVSHADIIIGADGRMSSVARKFVNGDNTPVFQGFVNWIGTFESSNPIFTEFEVKDHWGVGERFGIVPISSTKTYWAAAVAATEVSDKSPENYKSDLLRLFRDWPSPIETIIRGTPQVNINKIYVHDHDPMEPWHKDNVLVIGDAAHAPLPTSGQGACQALEDAWHLAELLGTYDGNIDSVFSEFTKVRFQKTTTITMGARKFASSLFNTDPEFCFQRNQNSMSTDFDTVVSGMARGWSSGLPL